MKRNGEDIFAATLQHLAAGESEHGTVMCGRQRVGLRRSRSENRRSSVALVHVTIDSHGSLDEFALLHAADSNGDVVHHAEALAVIREGMMEAAADVDAHTLFES